MTDEERLRNYLIVMGAALLLGQMMSRIWDKRKRHKVADFYHDRLADMYLTAHRQKPTLDADVMAKMTEKILCEIEWEDEND